MADYYLERMAKQIEEVDADLLEIQAGLARAKAEGNDYSVDSLLKGYATARATRRDLEAAANEYHAALNRPAAPPMTDAEFMAMSPERMMQNPECLNKIFEKSKHYTKEMWSDPEVQRRVQAGLAEVQRRNSYEKTGR